ncbi:MAG: hypothetical protein PUE08_05685 [Eubacteriales bacterium]|nr:hypothetical protein [Eubacteriales bacterium]
MKGKVLVVIKNIFCIITILWSFLMLFEYTFVLIGVPGIIYEVFDFCILFLYLGIFAVPTLFIVSAILMAVTGKNMKKRILKNY